MAQYGFYINMNHCSTCKVCVIACKDVNDLKVGFNFRHVDNYEGGTNTGMGENKIWAASISLACNHCTSPLCMASCPVRAIVKEADTGLVVVDKKLCDGCQACVTACPYGAPVYFPDKNVVDKCHGCRGLLAVDEKPACVAACSTRCLDFGPVDELMAKYGTGTTLVNIVQGLPAPETGPNLLINPKPQTRV